MIDNPLVSLGLILLSQIAVLAFLGYFISASVVGNP